MFASLLLGLLATGLAVVVGLLVVRVNTLTTVVAKHVADIQSLQESRKINGQVLDGLLRLAATANLTEWAQNETVKALSARIGEVAGRQKLIDFDPNDRRPS